MIMKIKSFYRIATSNCNISSIVIFLTNYYDTKFLYSQEHNKGRGQVKFPFDITLGVPHLGHLDLQVVSDYFKPYLKVLENSAINKKQFVLLLLLFFMLMLVLLLLFSIPIFRLSNTCKKICKCRLQFNSKLLLSLHLNTCSIV